MILKNKVYDVLKYVVLIVLPALATLYTAMAGLWDWGYVEQVAGSLSAVETFLGALICISTAGYNRTVKE